LNCFRRFRDAKLKTFGYNLIIHLLKLTSLVNRQGVVERLESFESVVSYYTPKPKKNTQWNGLHLHPNPKRIMDGVLS
jgi:hypothetical protein